MMLDVEGPGELPLMQQLTALKKSNTAQNSSRRFPLLESLPSAAYTSSHPLESEGGGPDMNLQVHGRYRHYPGEGLSPGRWDGSHAGADAPKRDVAPGRGASSRSARSPQGMRFFDSTSLTSPPVNDFNSKIMDWDAFGDAPRLGTGSGRSSAEHLQQQSLQNHLERLGIVGNQGRGSQAETSLLHNWRNVDDAGPLHAIPDEEFELEPGQERSQRFNAQTLSPLVLNPHDDNYSSRQQGRQPLFCLEEDASFEGDLKEQSAAQRKAQHNKERLWTDMNRGSRARSPLRPHRVQMATKGLRPLEMHSPPFMFRPGTLETEFFEYDIETLEQPSTTRRPINHKHSSEQPLYTQEQYAGYSFASMKPLTRHSASGYEASLSLQKHNHLEGAYTFDRSWEAEPLPLLTELEDYNGSDGYGETSVDGDFGTSSINEHQGALQPASRRGCGGASGNGHVKTEGSHGLQLSVRDCKEVALCESHPRNLSQKYRPKAFAELVGQPIVTQALSNAIVKGRIAPVYLFQGSRGTGKTTAARIFASALICISSEGQRPCGVCRECTSVAKGINSEIKEVDAASNNGIERVKVLLEETISAPALSRYKIFIIDECHVLTAETWNALLKILEEPPMNVVFILITTDVDRLPRTALSRCQKFPFPKIKDSEIIKRLQNLTIMENLSIDPEILQLIASRSDGSLRDAETTLDQVTLLGHQVNPSTVHELVGCASDDRLLSLLDAALVADTLNTVRRARELIDSGMEPLSLMSHLATLITDILAGTFKFTESQRQRFFQKQVFSEEKLERLRTAMKILAEAEKQIRVSNDRTTWLIAALLQLGPDRMCMFSASCAGTSVTQSPIALDDLGENDVNDFELRSTERRTVYHHEQAFMETDASHERSYHESEKSHLEDDPLDISFKDPVNEQTSSPMKLDDIWLKVMEKCRSLHLRQLLYASVKLTSISITEVDATVHLEVCHPSHQFSCDRSRKSIAHLFDLVLGFPVDIKISRTSLPTEDAQGILDWRKQKSTNDPNSSHRLLTMESFPAILSPSSQNQSYLASPWNNAGQRSAMHVNSQVEAAMKTQGAEGLMPILRGTAMNFKAHGSHHNQGIGDSNGYIQDAFFEERNIEEERFVNEMQVVSPNAFEVKGLQDKSRLRQSGFNELQQTRWTHDLDAQYQSCADVECKQKEGNTEMMVRHLSIGKQEKPSSNNPNSPDERGGYLRVSRFSIKANVNPQKHRNLQASKQTADLEEEAQATQKKGKLKGAAGSLAKFFHGKLNK